MGKISESFSELTYINEAQVSQNFVIPFLVEFLGYEKKDIIPENDYPNKIIPFGRREFKTKYIPQSQRPDYVICQDSIDKPLFVVDSKGPSEKLEEHLSQLLSYSLGAGVNFLVLTNGTEMLIYYGQDEVLKLSSISDLDIYFEFIKSLLHKDIHIMMNSLEIINSADFNKIKELTKDTVDEQKRKNLLIMTDFNTYLNNLHKELTNWHLPLYFSPDLFYDIVKVSPNNLHNFKRFDSAPNSSDELLTFEKVNTEINSQIKIIYGVQGIGKSTILNYMAYIQAERCIKLEDTQIPIIIKLRSYGLNKDINSLIMSSLNKLDYKYNDNYFINNLNNNEFIFYFDGFDEIQEKYRIDAMSEISDIIRNYPRHRFFITSRTRDKILISAGLSFEIQPLSIENLRNFCKQNLRSRTDEFLHKVAQLNLFALLRNTLILTFMIQIFRSGGEFPNSRARIIESILNGVENWENEKNRRKETLLPWSIKQELLELLSYTIAVKTLNLSIFYSDFIEGLFPLIEKYEKNREIPLGLDRKTILNDLHSTGIVVIDEDGCTFRNIAFLEHFASIALSKYYENDPTILEGIIDKLNWNNIISATSSKIPDSTEYVQKVFSLDPIKGVACLIEANIVSDSIASSIVKEIAKQCDSTIPIIRNKSLFYLSRIDKKFTADIYFDLLESKFDYVKMNAIEEISKLNTVKSKEIVLQYFDWDAGGMALGDTTQGVIARSLSNFDEEEYHLKIIDIWEKKVDIFTNTSVETALLNLIYTSKLGNNTRDKILDLFFKIRPETTLSWMSKWRSIAKVLIELGDELICDKLIEGFNEDFETAYLRSGEISKILGSIDSDEITEKLLNIALSDQEPTLKRAGCVKALTLSFNESITLEHFTKLFSDSDPNIRSTAIRGLSKFSFNDVECMLKKGLQDENYLVHSNSIKLFGSFGRINLLVKESLLPSRFNLRLLLDEIKKYRTHDYIQPILSWCKNWINSGRYKTDERTFLSMVDTLISLGQRDEGLELIKNFYDDGLLVFNNEYAYVDVAEMCVYFDVDTALKILDDYYSGIKEYIKTKEVKSHSLYIDIYIELIERIDNDGSLAILMGLSEEYSSHITLLERSLRAIGKIGYINPKKIEEWLIIFISKHKDIKNMELNRAIELLGFYGSEKSFSIITELAKEHKESDYILSGCYRAYENLLKRNNIQKFIDEDVFLK